MNAKQLKKKVKQILLVQALNKKNAALNQVLNDINEATNRGRTSVKWSDSDRFHKFSSYEISELEKRGFTVTKSIEDLSEEDVQYYKAIGCGELTPEHMSWAVYEITWDKPKNRVVSLVRYYFNKYLTKTYDEWERGYNQFKREM